ncbi:hypothetical protein [Nocardioides xinjiangensis]|uniref:hypothetical protein n=1 Tax=Nocardioides xinjiangensis TaxID=2817376 RepID=UPI001B308125|nr:hypothetical protein [Nocardioides sp. SYSU D00514]
MATLLTTDASTTASALLRAPWATGHDEVVAGRAVTGLGTPGSGAVRGPVAALDRGLTGLGRLVSEVAAGASPVALGLGEDSTAVLDGATLRVLSGRAYVVRPSLSGARVVVVDAGGLVDV